MSIYKYVNQQILKQVTNKLKVLSDLSENEISDPKDEVKYFFEARANLDSPLFLSMIANIVHM